MKEKIRCFVALDLPEGAVREIRKIQEKLKERNLFSGKFTESENLHLTLKFLGEITEEKLKRVREKLREIRFEEFDADLGEVGVFSQKFLRIIWIQVIGKVFQLQREIDAKLKDFFQPEFRFMSHVTIARIKKVSDRKALIECLKKIRVSKTRFKVDKFLLKKSELTPDGPIYTNIEEYGLEKNKNPIG